MVFPLASRSRNFCSLAIGLATVAGCSRESPADRASLTRLATDRAIEFVEIPDASAVPAAASGSVLTELHRFEDWSWFLSDNAFSSGPLIMMPAGLTPDELRRSEAAIVLRSGLGVAAWIAVDGKQWIEVDDSITASDEPGLSVGVIELDRDPEPLGAIVAPGRLRDVLSGSLVGRVHRLESAGDGAGRRALFRTRPDTRSLLVVARAEGAREGRLERVVVRRSGPFAALVAENRVSERFVADVDIGGVTRPSLVLPSGATIVTRPLRAPPDAVLRAHGSILGIDASVTDGASLTVTAEWGGQENTSGAASLQRGAWRPWVLDLAGASGQPVRFRFRFDAPSTADQAVAIVGTPRLEPSPDAVSSASPLRVVLISLDTLRADRLGAYGHAGGLTPNLDRLAARGTLFENAYANAPYTLPSHVTMFSGLLPIAHGVERYDGRVPAGLPWLPTELANGGYETAAFTAGGFVAHDFGFGRGFDLYCEVDPLGDRYTPGHALDESPFADGAHGSLPRALSWLTSRGDRPSFLFLHTYMAHEFLPPVGLAREFGLLDEGEPPLTFAEASRFDWLRVQNDGLSAPDRRRMVDAYDATVKACDDMIGEVLAAIEESGVADRTIIVVTSDHGEELLDHGGAGHGVTLYEEVIRVPLILRIPGAPSGQRVRERVSLVDLAPSLLELVGREIPPEMAGESFAPVFAGKSIASRTVISSVDVPPRSSRIALIENDWKLVSSKDDVGYLAHPRARVELYDLTTDPDESESRSDAEPEITATMIRRLERIQRDAATRRLEMAGTEEVRGALSAELEERLKELGYLGG